MSMIYKEDSPIHIRYQLKLRAPSALYKFLKKIQVCYISYISW